MAVLIRNQRKRGFVRFGWREISVGKIGSSIPSSAGEVVVEQSRWSWRSKGREDGVTAVAGLLSDVIVERVKGMERKPRRAVKLRQEGKCSYAQL